MDRSESNKDTDSFSMSNDFDIVEHFSDDDDDSSKNDLPSPIYDPSGFPKAKHRSLLEYSLSKPQEYDNSILKPFEEMTLEEIKDAQNYLYEKLGKEMCDFIKERKLKRMEESKNMDKNQDTKQEESKLVNTTDGTNELIFKFDRKEFLKFQWMNPSETNKDDSTDKNNGRLNLHELRFDFEGRLLTYSETNEKSYDTSLYNHGLDSDKPGYTFVELVHLLQSSFKPQVQISIRSLNNILFQSYFEYESKEFNCSKTYNKCFFSYPQYRWNNYINNDLDLVSKVGYSVCENQLSLSILVDSLRCLSILLFGDSSSWNNFDFNDSNSNLDSDTNTNTNYKSNDLNTDTNIDSKTNSNFIVQVQDVLFDYYQFYMGVDTYYWNPLFLDLMETNLFDGSDSIFENVSCNCRCNNCNCNNSNCNSSCNCRCNDKINNTEVKYRLKMFYSKCLEGHYQSKTVDEIVKDLFGVIDENKCNNSNSNLDSDTNTNTNTNLDTNLNKEMDLKMDSTLFLLSKNNILYKLLLIMQRYKDNMKVQLYCISSICGFVRCFGTPLVNALVEFQLFKLHFEWLAEYLVGHSNKVKGLVHLENAFLYLVKYISIYLDDLGGFFDTSSSVSAIKNTLTRSFNKELKSLNMISDFDYNTNEQNQLLINRYATIALNCMTVWSLKEYLFDTLDEFVPVVNLMMYKVKECVKEKNKFNLFFNENSERLSAFNLHFSSCIRLNDMYNHFEYNGVIANVNELVNLFATNNLWSDESGYYLYSLLQLQYDYINSLYNNEINYEENEYNEEKQKQNEQNEQNLQNNNNVRKQLNQKLKDLEFSEDSLVIILDMISDLDDFIYTDYESVEQLILLTWFDDRVFGGSNGCMYNESLVNFHFKKSILPFNCLNLALNILIKLKFVDVKNCEMNNESFNFNKLDNVSYKLKEKLFKLGQDIIKTLKKVYFNLHNTKKYYLNNSVYLVKSVPVFESWLVYLRTLVDLGFDDSYDAIFTILALSVDYSLIENTLNLLSSRFSLIDSQKVFKYYCKFNRYISGYSLGSDKLPLVSFLSFLTYLPLLTNLNTNLNLDFQHCSNSDCNSKCNCNNSNCNKNTNSQASSNDLNKEMDLKIDSTLFLLLSKLVNSGTVYNKFLEWSYPTYLFSQLVYTVGSNNSDNLFYEFTNDHYYIFQKLLFSRVSACCELRVIESDEILDRWVDSLEKFIPNDDYKGLGLLEYFKDEQDMLTYCNKLVSKFNSGQHDSPITIGLIMLFISYLSTEECCKTIWSDDCLMILLGRNLCFDFNNFELLHTYDSSLVDRFSIGNMFTFASPFTSQSILRSQIKLIKNFSDDSIRDRDPVLFLTILSLWKGLTNEELETLLLDSNSNSSLVKELLKRLINK